MVKSVIVTGASRGIGAAIVRSLRIRGVQVVGVARTQSALQMLAMEKLGSAGMDAVVGDVTDSSVVKAAIAKATADGRTLVGLILNAGVVGPVKPVAQMTDEDMSQFEASLQVNLTSSIPWIREAIPHLRANNGRFIYTSSGVVSMAMPGFAAYTAGKAAMNTVISSLAAEEPLVVSIALTPGIVQTDMADEFLERGRPYLGPQFISHLESIRQKGTIGKPEDVAEAYAKCILAAPKEKSGKMHTWNDAWITNLQV